MADKELVIKKASFNIYDMKYEEAWLNSFGAEGLMLQKVTAAFLGKKYHFEQTDKNGIRYSIIPKTKDEISDEEHELLKSAGWNPICEKGCTYYYTDDPNGEDIFTDKESYRQYHRKQFKHTAWQAALYFITALGWVAILRTRLTGSSGLESLGYTTLYSDIGTLVMYASLVFYWLGYAVYIMKSRREYLTGSYSDLSKVLLTRKIMAIGLIFIMVLMSLSFYVVSICGKTELDQSDSLSYKGEHPALLRNVFPDEWEFAEERIKDPDTEEIFPAEDGHGRVSAKLDYDYSLNETGNLTLKKGHAESLYSSGSTISPMDTRETEEPDKSTTEYIDWLADNYSSTVPEYESVFYEFRSEEKANKLIKREIENHVDALEIELGGKDLIRVKKQKSKSLQGEDAIKAVSIDVPDVDYAGFIDERKLNPETNGYGFQYLYLLKGNKVVYVSYSGKHNLIEKIDVFAQQFR